MLKQTVVNKLIEIKAWINQTNHNWNYCILAKTNSQFCIKINNQIN